MIILFVREYTTSDVYVSTSVIFNQLAFCLILICLSLTGANSTRALYASSLMSNIYQFRCRMCHRSFMSILAFFLMSHSLDFLHAISTADIYISSSPSTAASPVETKHNRIPRFDAENIASFFNHGQRPWPGARYIIMLFQHSPSGPCGSSWSDIRQVAFCSYEVFQLMGGDEWSVLFFN